MNREIPYDENLICDICGHKGAFDFMGDYICDECASKAIENDGKHDEIISELDEFQKIPGKKEPSKKDCDNAPIV